MFTPTGPYLRHLSHQYASLTPADADTADARQAAQVRRALAAYLPRNRVQNALCALRTEALASTAYGFVTGAFIEGAQPAGLIPSGTAR